MSKVSHIPEGYNSITPYLIIKGAAQAIEYYKSVFGATEVFRMDQPDGKVGHAELKIGDSRVMLADENLNMGAGHASAASIGQSPVTMVVNGLSYEATIPAQPDGTRVDYAVSANAGGQTTVFALGYFSGTTPIGSLRGITAKGEPLFAAYAARVRGVVTAGKPSAFWTSTRSPTQTSISK